MERQSNVAAVRTRPALLSASPAQFLPTFEELEVRTAGTLHLVSAPKPFWQFPSGDLLPASWLRPKNGRLILDAQPLLGQEMILGVNNLQLLILAGRCDIICKLDDYRSLFTLRVTGSGSITWAGMANEIEAVVDGAGTLELEGQARVLNARICSSGELKAFGLQAENLWLNSSGSGKCQVRASHRLNVTIQGSGEVAYKGYPEIESQHKAAGRLVNAN